jgi:uncharacterized protein YjbI with pentapeptide repeats
MPHTSPRREETRRVDQQQQSRWQPTRRQLLWTCGVVAALGVSLPIGYRYGITLWDWIKLLIVPAAIAAGGVWFNQQQREREQDIAQQRAQDEALQAYLDQMGQLLLDKDMPLRKTKESDEVRILARARTLTVLGRLDGDRKRSVVQFLYEADLINKKRPVISLTGANLSRANLRSAVLPEASLRGADLSRANLHLALLREASLDAANLADANLDHVQLGSADLHGANLSRANLTRAFLDQVDLRAADLTGANLREAGLMNANLRLAKLRGANLHWAYLPSEATRREYHRGINLERKNPDITFWEDMQSQFVSSYLWSLMKAFESKRDFLERDFLEGATLPSGQKFEDWLNTPHGQMVHGVYLREKQEQGRGEG